LITLEHCSPDLITLNCSNNHLISLKGCDSICLNKLLCNNNNLTSLEHCPPNLKSLDCSDNNLKNINCCPLSVNKICCSKNNRMDITGCPDHLVDQILNSIGSYNITQLCKKMRKKNKKQETQIKELNDFIEHLKYAPGGYEQAKADFESVRNNYMN